ncbi:uncharacterized protein BXIN_2936 [Babesia sp. Xinjiang]|uniref:uncharacterized protein n=1 Tax=Babesia sp. Xinjiang TaxID=462227 RepID=UPI000A249D8F|nr:uncharacterized protein BXIN_2936 [Babesia sp. Xinjiang]ORM39514.1 hypothetical protein BXIN_2936 [Babesia sp. Xinjiang]
MERLPKSSTSASGQMQDRQATWEYRLCCSKATGKVVAQCSGNKRPNDVVVGAKPVSDNQRRRCKKESPPANDGQSVELQSSQSTSERCVKPVVNTDTSGDNHEYLFLWDDESGLIIKYPLYEEQHTNLSRSLVTYPENKKDDDDVPTDTRVINWSLQVVESYLQTALEIAQSRASKDSNAE